MLQNTPTDSTSKLSEDGHSDSEIGYGTMKGIAQLHHLNWKGIWKTQSRAHIADPIKGQTNQAMVTFICTHCPHSYDSKEAALIVQTVRNKTEMKRITSKIPQPSRETCFTTYFYDMVGGHHSFGVPPNTLCGVAYVRHATAWTIGPLT